MQMYMGNLPQHAYRGAVAGLASIILATSSGYAQNPNDPSKAAESASPRIPGDMTGKYLSEVGTDKYEIFITQVGKNVKGIVTDVISSSKRSDIGKGQQVMEGEILDDGKTLDCWIRNQRNTKVQINYDGSFSCPGIRGNVITFKKIH